MLVGEPGVGKTAVIEGLARLIELEPEKVPMRLRGSHIVQLQMGGIVAGTMLRGMFEERIKGIIDEVKERDNLISSSTKHTRSSGGRRVGTSSDAANMFKSALARGDAHHRRDYSFGIQRVHRRRRSTRTSLPHGESRRAVDQRDQGDPARSSSATREKLLRQNFRRRHQHCVGDGSKYIRNLHLPDKAIGWLDTAAVKVEINEPQKMVVRPEHVIEVISQESRIPRDMIFRDTAIVLR